MSLDLTRIRDLGAQSYRLRREEATADGHRIVEHEALVLNLRQLISEGEKGERQKAIQAFRYASNRREGLVDWQFDISGVERKDLINWATARVQRYFSRV